MQVEEIMDFADWENKRVETASSKTNNELIDSQIMKIGEEYGEFINEFLKIYKWQRKDKITNIENSKKELEKEFADIILTSFLAARRLGIDPIDALENKMEVVRARKY